MQFRFSDIESDKQYEYHSLSGSSYKGYENLGFSTADHIQPTNTDLSVNIASPITLSASEHLKFRSYISDTNNNFYNELKIKRAIRQELLKSAKESVFEYGKTSLLQNKIESKIKEYGSLFIFELVNEIFLDEFKNPFIASGIILTLSHMDYSIVSPQGPTMALAALSNKDEEVVESGIRAFENWEEKDCLIFLESVTIKFDWLNCYLKDVILYLQEL